MSRAKLCVLSLLVPALLQAAVKNSVSTAPGLLAGPAGSLAEANGRLSIAASNSSVPHNSHGATAAGTVWGVSARHDSMIREVGPLPPELD
jgi:hypothetical protein